MAKTKTRKPQKTAGGLVRIVFYLNEAMAKKFDHERIKAGLNSESAFVSLLLTEALSKR